MTVIVMVMRMVIMMTLMMMTMMTVNGVSGGREDVAATDKDVRGH